jgi:hypothetical protein
MTTKTPPEVFEVVFQGKGIYPEIIPFGTLSRSLSAVYTLATGTEPPEEDAADDEIREEAIRLLRVKRGSAVYSFCGPAPETPIQNLRLVGKVLAQPESIGSNDYMLSPVERLSKAARNLGCVIVVREAGKDGKVLARIEPTSFDNLSRTLFVDGDTSVSGEVKRVGGATKMRCALRVDTQHRLLFCTVVSEDVARKLGDCLYKQVVAHGRARWIKGTWRLHSFEVRDVHQLEQGSLNEAIDALRAAGAKDWDRVDDPQSFLEEITGK